MSFEKRARGMPTTVNRRKALGRNRRALLVPLLALCQGLTAHADATTRPEDFFSLSLQELMETEVFISTNTKQSLSRAPSVVSVITAEDIKATGATNLSEILQSVPGIYIRPNLFGFRPQVTFRGASSTHTLLMVDGTPLRDLVWNAGIFWRGLPTNMIDRIEIIRGPGSALFGSDASAGAINIITKTAGRIQESEIGLRVGSFDTQTGWVQHGWGWNGFEFGLTAELSHTDGHDPFIPTDGQTSRDNTTGARASYAPGHAGYGWDNEDIRFSVGKGNWRLHTNLTRRRNVEIGLTGYGALDPVTRGEDSRFNVELIYNNPEFATDWALNSELSYQHLDYSSGAGFIERPPGFMDGADLYPDGLINQMRSAERGGDFDVSGLYTGFKAHAIRLGGGYSWRDLYSVEQSVNFGTGPAGTLLPAGGPLMDLSDTPYAFAPEKARQIGYLFVQDVWALADDWELTAGARYDHYSDFGGAVVPRLALVWQTTDRLTTKLMYGQAFRAPSYLELYAPTAATRPNPDLTPERSETWDLSFSYKASKDLKLGLNLYQFAQSELIGVDALNQFQNMDDNRSNGVELEAMWQATNTLRISGNLTHRKDSTPYNSVPKQTAYLRTDWAFAPKWNWNVQANRIGKHSLAPGDPRAPIGAYTWADTTVRYAPRQDLEFAASIRNLFDVDARELSSRALPDNLPLPERSLFVEVRYKL